VPGDVHAAAGAELPVAAGVPLQPWERVLSRRAKVIVGSALGVVAAGVALVVGGALVVTGTDWGHRRLRDIATAQLRGVLADGVTLRVGRVDGRLGSTWSAESVSVTGADGRDVVFAARVSADVRLGRLARGEVRLGLVRIDGLRLDLVQDRNGAWNVARLTAPRGGTRTVPGPARLVTIDSVVVSAAAVSVTQPDTAPARPAVRRRITGIGAALGPTVVSTPEAGVGGSTTLRAFSATMDNPRVQVTAARGSAGWWGDSLHFNVTTLRLPRSTVAAIGGVEWGAGTSRISADVRIDTLSLADLRAIEPRLPDDGVVRARATVRSRRDGALEVAVRDLDAQSGSSRVSGTFTIVAGDRPEVREVRARFAPIDLDLVRALAGDSAVGAWRGSVDATVVAAGGALDSLVVDSAAVTFHDARTGLASHASLAGTVGLDAGVIQFGGLRVTLDSFPLRTLATVAPAADTIRGRLRGRVTLDGTPARMAFHDLVLRHEDGDAAASQVSGGGTVAPDRRGRWLDAKLTLDTVSLATLLRGRTSLDVSGRPHGDVSLHADGDTVFVDATIRDGAAEVHVTGTTRIDSTRTAVAIEGTLRGVDPTAFVARRNLPQMSLSGRVSALIDGAASGPSDRHVVFDLDSTSRIGNAPLRTANVRVGLDETGLHVDTAVVVADDWSVEAVGRLGADSTSSDTLRFAADVRALASLRSILLDSAGAPLFPDIAGAVRVHDATLVGSVRQAALRATVSGDSIGTGDAFARAIRGVVDLRALPERATGTVTATIDGLATGGAAFDTVRIDARLDGGERARAALRATSGDTAVVAGAGTVTWPDNGWNVQVDSLAVGVGHHRWALMDTARATIRGSALAMDTVRFRSDHGARIIASFAVPEGDAVRGNAEIVGLGFEELSFLGLLPADLEGRISARLALDGTRAAPLYTIQASLDSISSDQRERPSLRVHATYANRSAAVDFRGFVAGRQVFEATGDVPVDLSLQSVESRLPDAPVTLRVVADSTNLVAFDGLAPGIRNLGGFLNGTVNVGGTLRRPRGAGTLALSGGSFELPRSGIAARNASAVLELAGDSVMIRKIRVVDTDSPRDTVSATGVVRLTGTSWHDWDVDVKSVASRFRVIDDPRLATAEAAWNLSVTGALVAPRVTGSVRLPYAVFTIGPQRRTPRAPSDAGPPPGTPVTDGVVVTLGSDVRLKSREANVQLAGGVELFGPLNNPWISGSVRATRGTYRVDLISHVSRTFAVDSGVVILEGTSDMPPALDIHATYVVRRPSEDDVKIRTHLYGTTVRPRLDFSSDLGSATAQSEIISYLVFGKPSFAVAEGGATAQTAYQALVPSFLGGWLEGLLSSVMPFFNSLQVSTVGRDDPRFTASNPLEGLLSSFAVTGGRQIGTDTFVSLTTGVCTGNSTTVGGRPLWLGTAAEYRPRGSVGVALTIDPGPAPCSRTSQAGGTYQFGLDLLYDWTFTRRP
jgi:autotransporter translocation and assembly factor TamB